MFTFKTITDPADLARYITAYQQASHGVSLDIDYLNRARRVVVAYNTANPDTYLGGYVINDEPPMRYFIAPGEIARNQALARMHLTEADLVEIGAIWLAQYRSPLRELHRLFFFGAMLRDALRTNKPYVLGGSFIRQVQEAQRVVLPQLIYDQRITVGAFTGDLQLYVGRSRHMWRRYARCVVVNAGGRLRKALRRAGQRTQTVARPVHS